jgi:hypothetical protein
LTRRKVIDLNGISEYSDKVKIDNAGKKNADDEANKRVNTYLG